MEKEEYNKIRESINKLEGVEKEFKLSDKRKELFEEVFDKKIEKELFVIFNCIEDQDKEFIKRLKEFRHPKVNHMLVIPEELLDKLAGDLG